MRSLWGLWSKSLVSSLQHSQAPPTPPTNMVIYGFKKDGAGQSTGLEASHVHGIMLDYYVLLPGLFMAIWDFCRHEFIGNKTRKIAAFKY